MHVGPLFGFIAGWLIDKYGPRRLMMAGVLMMGVALVGLSFSDSLGLFYLFYVFNALGFTVLICVALAGALIVSFLPKARKSKD